MEAAGAIGLSMEMASQIAAAVNDRTWTGGNGERTVDEKLRNLRREIARAVGLSV